MLVAISGGIGSGKSVVARMLLAMGYAIYDCDTQARHLIDGSQSIKGKIAAALGEVCINPDGSLDRKAVSEIVFNDAVMLEKLNAITHAAVRDDLHRWYVGKPSGIHFVETAILYQSGIDMMVDAVVEITAPLGVRIARIQLRNGLEYNDIIRRIESQNFTVDELHPSVYTIINDDMAPILPQLQSVLTSLKSCQ